ncbi:MAG TPA: hypothetical protein VNK70_01650, partial [Candidatus Paceibacterota bacterium]|nr:hypothetical protein [Candidatus Paceibacterota bacterium]
LRLRVRRGVREAERDLHREFVKLRETMKKHLKSLEYAGTKRELTKEERKILEQLTADLAKTEKVLEGEIEEIEKDAT